MPKQQITQKEYLQLVGLKALADKHNRMLLEIDEAANAITETESGGHISDLMWEVDAPIDQKLEWAKISVEDKDA